MEEIRKMRIAANAESAFETAENCGYIGRGSSEKEVTDNAYQILEWMPELKPDELSEEEFDYAVECLLNEIE